MTKKQNLLGQSGDLMDNQVEIITAREGRKTKVPLVSVIVINNGDWQSLERAIESVSDQAFADLEISVVTNAWPEIQTDKVRETWPSATIIHSRNNLGFCKGANLAATAARGRYLFFLDTRSWLHGASLGKLVETIETEPDAGIVGPLLLNEDRSLQSIGMKIDQLGRPIANLALFDADTEIIENAFYVPGSAMMVNKELFSTLAGFDESYFSGLEDADICWRARLLGRKIVINPWSIAFSGDTPGTVSYLQYRNSLRMIIKNYGSLRATAGSARFVGTTIAESFKSLAKLNLRLSWQYWKVLLWNLAMLPSSIRERRLVQSLRLRNDEWILRDGIMEEDDSTVGLASPDRAA